MPLLDQYGRPMPASFKKAKPPVLGEKFGNWAGREDLFIYSLPGGGFLQFDLSKLTLADFRQMKDHYQVQASLSVLTFMLHQLDWSIECENKKIEKFCTGVLERVWTRLVRGMSQAFWAGYSPMVLQWENNIDGRAVELTKIKDLIPEECEVNWKEVPGWVPPGKNTIPPKLKIYDGIKQWGAPYPIPRENTLWYPVLSENGDYYGRKLLRSAFQPYFFSMLMHLFANRYYERFGEPVPVGRAPYDSEVTVNGTTVKGNEAMREILTNFRNRSVVVLPDDRDEKGNPDYSIEYLESQMRGADFERYITRLDEEISLSLFTPLLMLRTADVGSYNLGTGHTQVYLWMLNAISGDWAEYIDKYILKPLKNFNFGERAPVPRIRFRKLGTQAQETLRAVLSDMVRGGMVKVNLEDLGQAIGMRLEEVREVTEPPKEPQDDPNEDPKEDDPPKKDTRVVRDKPKAPKGIKEAGRISGLIVDRLISQYSKAVKEDRLGELKLDLGYRAQMESALEGVVDDPASSYRLLSDTVSIFMADFVAMDSYQASDGQSCIEAVVDSWMDEIEKVANGSSGS